MAVDLFVLNRAGLQEQIAQALRERIAAGHYRAGERLNIDALARDLEVSSTPVREALARLSAERIVEFVPNKGYRVMPPPDAGWLADLFDVRLLFEAYAVRLGAARRDQAILRRLEELHRQMGELTADAAGRRAFATLNRDFHAAIVDSARNRVLSRQYEPLSYQYEVALARATGSRDIAKAVQEHACILDAYHEGDRRTAEEALRGHLLAAEQRAAAVLNSRAEGAPRRTNKA